MSAFGAKANTRPDASFWIRECALRSGASALKPLVVREGSQ